MKLMRLAFVLAVGGVAWLVALAPAADVPASAPAATRPAAPLASVPAARLERLRRGVNLSMWFAQQMPDVKRFETYMRPEDFALIRSAGFGHVRWLVEWNVLMDEKNPAVLQDKHLKHFDAALDMILAADLAVIVSVNAGDDFKRRLYTDAGFQDKYARFWRSLAEHFATRDAARVYLQELSEPCMAEPKDWAPIQAKLAEQMRKGAPAHTLVLSANQRANGRGDMIGGLAGMTPLADRNVVYDFHFYEPWAFTHQGATWTIPQCKWMAGLPYPSSPRSVDPLLPKLEFAGRAFAKTYGQESWDRQRLGQRLADVAAWSRRNDRPVICGEFGVYRINCPPADRARYLRDVRESLEKLGIGWCMWEYLGGFGLVTEDKGQRIYDPATAEALGAATQPAAGK